MKNGEGRKKNGGIVFSHVLLLILLVSFNVAPFARAQSTLPNPDPSSSGFKIVICNGPAALNDPKTHQTLVNTTNPNGTLTQTYVTDPNWKPDPSFVACDFNGFMMEVQYVINVMIVLGVLAAIVGAAYAGGLYITGSEKNISRAKEIFPKIFWGFIIMLSAWFIVYQILSWLTGNSGFSSLLGNP